MYLVCLYGFRIHLQVPYFDREVISGQHVTSIMTEFDVRYAGNDFWEEATIGWVLWLFKNCDEKQKIQLNDTTFKICKFEDIEKVERRVQSTKI